MQMVTFFGDALAIQVFKLAQGILYIHIFQLTRDRERRPAIHLHTRCANTQHALLIAP